MSGTGRHLAGTALGALARPSGGEDHTRVVIPDRVMIPKEGPERVPERLGARTRPHPRLG
ncbi:hypothetical protein Pve01_43910 [Planomonospora venezuelensis]|nr:hypothetical protein Pve01_43910 [Planomonospora venezuelensis]